MSDGQSSFGILSAIIEKVTFLRTCCKIYTNMLRSSPSLIYE